MSINRRTALALFGSALAAPFILRSDRAFAAVSLAQDGPSVPIDTGVQPVFWNTHSIELDRFPSASQTFISSWIGQSHPSQPYATFVRFFSDSCTPLTPPIELGAPPGPTDGTSGGSHKPVAFADGRSLVFYASRRAGGPPDARPDIFVQRFKPNFKKHGIPIRVNQDTDGTQVEVDAVRTPPARAFATWKKAAGSAAGRLFGRSIGYDGAGLTHEQPVTTARPYETFQTSMVALSNGNIAVAYVEETPAGPLFKVQHLTPDGNRLRQPASIPNAWYRGGGLAALADGRCIVCYYVHVDDVGTTRLKSMIFDAAANVGPEVDIGEVTFDFQVGGSIYAAAQPGKKGPIVVLTPRSWVDDCTDGFEVRGWILDSEGRRLAGPTYVGAEFTGSIIFRTNGKITVGKSVFFRGRAQADLVRLRVVGSQAAGGADGPAIDGAAADCCC